jgi:signal transduction histidine kinase
VLQVLLLALVPTIGLLWFVGLAVRNEQLASRQRLVEAYRPQLKQLAQRMEQTLRGRSDRVDRMCSPESTPAAVFCQLVSDQVADSIVLLDAEGRPAYPRLESALPPSPPRNSPPWVAARRMESDQQWQVAAEQYGKLAQSTLPLDDQAAARQAQIRCLLQARQVERAAEIVDALSADRTVSKAVDASGRSLLPNLQWLLLNHADILSSRKRAEIENGLVRLLKDYDSVAMPATQRLLLMTQISQRFPGATFPTLDAERLAVETLEAASSDADKSWMVVEQLQPSPRDGVWAMTTPRRRALLLFRLPTLRTDCARLVQDASIEPGAKVRLLQPGEALEQGVLLVSQAIEALPGWRIGLSLDENGAGQTLRAGRAATYGWMGLLAVGIVGALSYYVVQSCRHEFARARWKNDLVGVVSHELRTPLASMRVLVDTLLDTPAADPERVREYLQTIAKENLRLSTLVDSFLTYSRLDHRRAAFVFAEVDVADLLQRVTEAAGDRFRSDQCHLVVRTAPALPPVRADADAMVTALLNLLDNAYKYSEDPRRIELTAHAIPGGVRIEVTDQGIGMSPRVCRRVFRQFYQADQRLTRTNSGCGLGLTIVQAIVNAHHGRISVRSQVGRGSTFSLELPANDVSTPARGWTQRRPASELRHE